MECPLCHAPLYPFALTISSGGKITAEHCGRCGGTWFDAYDINRIPYSEVVRMAGITVNPKQPSFSYTSAFCPKDRAELETYESDVLPAGVSLLRCPKCHGIWATQRSLAEFKRHQEETIGAYVKAERAFPSLSVVFIPALTLFLLFLSTFFTLRSLQDSRDDRSSAGSVIHTQHVQRVSPTSVLLTFSTTMPVRSDVSWGEQGGSLQTVPVSSSFSTLHQIVLGDVFENVEYVYRITLTDEHGRVRSTQPAFFRLPE